jgi:hypothetical protein
MICKLTGRQLDATLNALSDSWLYDWVTTEGKSDSGGKKIEVLLLPDGWLEISNYLIASFATAGGSRRGSPPLWDAMRKIVRAVNERATHPAFANTAVAGRQYEVIPAWVPHGKRNDRTLWSPWVTSDTELGHHELLHLWPTHEMDGGQMISHWEPAFFGGSPGSWMAPSWDDYARFIKVRSEA